MTFTPPTHKAKLAPEEEGHSKKWSLWRHYNWLDEGRTVIIDGGTVIPEASAGPRLFTTDELAAADSGSGENGLAVFRGARTYTVNSTESTKLQAAGYTVS